MKNIKKATLSLLAVGAVLISSSSSIAATSTGTLNVSGTAAISCSVAVPPLNMGVLLTGISVPDIPFTVTVNCPTPWNLTTSANEFPVTIGNAANQTATASVMNGPFSIQQQGPSGSGATRITDVTLALHLRDAGQTNGYLVGAGVISTVINFNLTY